MKSKLIWLPLSLWLAACASQPPATQEGGLTGPGSDRVPTVQGSAADGPAEASDEVMYRVFAGEVTGADGDMQSAANEYLAAAMESRDPEIAARATRIALAAQAWQHAVMASDRWVLLQPENIEARQTAARTMIIVGDYVGAEHHLNGIIGQMPNDRGRAWGMVASLLAASGNEGKSSRMLERLIQDNSSENDPDALFAKSRYLAARQRLDEAASLAGRIIELEPGRAEFHEWAGRIAVNREQLASALEHYQDAWLLQPGNQRIAMAYAELLTRNGEAVRAQEVLAGLEDLPATRLSRIAFALEAGLRELAEKIYGGFADANYADPMEKAFHAAQAAELLGWPAKAAGWYEKVASGERMLIAALRRAYLTAEAGDLAGARNQLSSLRLQHDAAIVRESFLAESDILSNADQPETAFELLTAAIERLPGDSALLYGRAMAAVQLDRLDQAERDLREIIATDPQNAAALNALGYTLADRMGRYEEAELLVRAAYELQPEEASIIDSMGWVAFRLGRLEEAEAYLREAWARDNNAEIAAHLGEVLWVRERREEALAVWQGGLEADPANPVLLETMERFGVGD